MDNSCYFALLKTEWKWQYSVGRLWCHLRCLWSWHWAPKSDEYVNIPWFLGKKIIFLLCFFGLSSLKALSQFENAECNGSPNQLMFTVLETKIYDNDSPPSDWRNLSSCLWFSFATFIGESVMRLNYEGDNNDALCFSVSTFIWESFMRFYNIFAFLSKWSRQTIRAASARNTLVT